MLFQAYTHGCLANAVKKGVKGESLPDVSKKGDVSDSVVSFAGGSKFTAWDFSSGSTATVDMVSIFKAEKGANALKALQSGQGASSKGVTVSSKVKASKGKAAPGLKPASQLIGKASKTQGKKSAKKSAGGAMATPGAHASAMQTPNPKHADFEKMRTFLQRQRAKKGKR